MEVKFSDNLFLAVAELNKMKQSLGEKGWKVFAKNLVSQFGIAQNEGNTMFLPIRKSGTNEVITIQPGVAFDSNMNIIQMDNSIDISVPAAQLTGDMKYWLILRHATNHYEEGTVNVSSDGALSGNGTDFLSVLRGQPDFPTKVRLESTVNTGDYEVVVVSSATSAIISGSFMPENNLKYSVIGTFTPGFIPSEENALIYEYDGYEIEVRISAEEPTLDAGNEFLICAVDYVNATMRIQDSRIYYMLNNPYVQTTDAMTAVSKDLIVSLTQASIVGLNDKGIMMELQFQHGFRILGFETNVLASGYVIDITSGGSNYISADETIPNSLFKGWYLLNLDTMAYSVITDSQNHRLFITELNPDSTSGTNLVLVPPFKEIEYQVTLASNTPSAGVPYVFKFGIENINNKVLIPVLFKNDNSGYLDEVTVSMKYRMVGSGTDKYRLYDLASVGYDDYDGVRRSVVNSSFVIHITEMQPEDSVRNYS